MQQSYLGKWTIVGGLIGLVAGLGATGFYFGIQLVTNFLLGGITGFYLPNPVGEGPQPTSVHPDFLLVPLVTIVGGLIAGGIVYGLAPEAEGHGTDEAITAFHRGDGKIRRRIPLVKAISSIFTLGSGGSGGREGPTAQIGAGFGSMIGDFFHLSVKDRRIAVAAGIGAGIGTIFKAPFAGAILGGEILYSGGDFEAEALVPAFIAAPTGYVIFASIVGFTPIFGYSPTNVFTDVTTLPIYIVLGVACGLAGRLYSTSLYRIKDSFSSLSVPRFVRPAIGAAVAGLIGVFFPQVLGLSYGFVQFLINGNLSAIRSNFIALPLLETLVIIMFAKIVATSFTVGSGGSAGVFAPSLVIGGFLGASFWVVLNSLAPGWIPVPAPLVIVGMMALFGGVGRAPIAVMLMVSEMTGSLSLLLPAVVAVILSYFVVGPKYTIYKSQVYRRSESPAHLGEYSTPLLRRMTLGQAMNPNVPSMSAPASVEVAFRRIVDEAAQAIAITDAAGKPVGIVTLSDVTRIPTEKRVSTLVGDVMTTGLITASISETLFSVMDKLITNEVGQVLVIEDGTGRLLGMVTLKDIMRAYDKAVQE